MEQSVLEPNNKPRTLQLLPQLEQRIARDFEPRWRDQWGSKFILHGKKISSNVVRLDGNDYLGISGHPAVIRSQIDNLRENKENVIQSGVFLHGENPTLQFETQMAAWLGKEDTLICQSGYTANMGLLQAIADSTTPVYIDAMAHASLWEGIRAANAPCIPFRHNDMVHLERHIKIHGAGIIVVDSVYSTNGSVCPLREMLALTHQYHCMIIVDESHSLGLYGPNGSGLCAELELTSQVHFITSSLAKTFAGRGGILSIPAKLRHYIHTTSFPHIFSSCLLPHEIAGLSETLKIIKGADLSRSLLKQHTRRLRHNLSSMGYPISQGSEHIIALEVGTEAHVMRVRDALEDAGIVGAIFCTPATSRNRALIRLTLRADLTEADLSKIEYEMKRLLPVINPSQWVAARKEGTMRHIQSVTAQ